MIKQWLARRRRRYSIWQVQNGKLVACHGRGLTETNARRDSATVNETLMMAKLIAPSGPKDARCLVVLDETCADWKLHQEVPV